FQGFKHQWGPLGRPGQRPGLLQQALQPGQCHGMNPPRVKNKDKRPTAGRGNTMLGRKRGHRDADNMQEDAQVAGGLATRRPMPAKAVYELLQVSLARPSAGPGRFFADSCSDGLIPVETCGPASSPARRTPPGATAATSA